MRILLFALFLLLPLAAQAQTAGGACTTVGQTAMANGGAYPNILYCNGTTWVNRIVVDSTGKVGVNTTTPTATLDVTGALYSRSNNAGSLTTIDWSAGNTQYTTASCGAFTFSNMQDGGSYQLFVEGTTQGTCSFSHTGLTFKLPSNHGATTSGSMTVYSFSRVGSLVFVTWIPGY